MVSQFGKGKASHHSLFIHSFVAEDFIRFLSTSPPDSELSPFPGLPLYKHAKAFFPAATTSTVNTGSVSNTETCSLKSQTALNFLSAAPLSMT